MFRKNKVILKIRQPAQWNRYVDPTIPLTWSKRWQTARVALPLLCITFVLLLEMVLGRAFLEGVELRLPPLLIVFVAFPVFLALCVEVAIRSTHWASRTLVLRRNGLGWEHGKPLFFNWKMVKAFEFAAIPGIEGPRKLCVRIAGSKGRIFRKCLVLPGPREFDELSATLRQRETYEGADYELLEHDEPAKRTRFRLLPIWCWAFGFFFLVHGFPLLGVALTKGGADEPSEPQKPREERKVNPVVEDWIIRNFKSKEEVTRAFLLSGIMLTAAAAGCFFAAGRMEWEFKETEQRLPEIQNFQGSVGDLPVNRRTSARYER